MTAQQLRLFPDEYYKELHTPAECRAHYKDVSGVYDKKTFAMQYNGPVLVTKYLKKYADPLGIEKDAKILDAFAGTGLTGVKLYEAGYTNLDAFDGCKEMMAHAVKRNIYKNNICHLLDVDDPLPIPNNAYDAVVLTGAMYSTDHILEFMRIIKPGGIFINVFRDEIRFIFPELQNLEEFSHQWQKEGKWNKLEEGVITEMDFYAGYKAFLQAYQVL